MENEIHNTWDLVHWVQAIYGWLIIQAFIINRNKNKIDKNNDGVISKGEFKEYMIVKIWALSLSFFCIPLGIWVLPYVWTFFVSSIEWNDNFYVAAGLASWGVEQILHKTILK